jgi:hypothetical protein
MTMADGRKTTMLHRSGRGNLLNLLASNAPDAA